MKVTIERWKTAQNEEVKHYSDLSYEISVCTFKVIADYLGINFEEDFEGRTIIEVGAGPYGAVLMCKGAFRRAAVIEPLIDKYPLSIRELYKKNDVEVIVNAYELEDLGHFDETWLFNVLQHVICPEEILKKAAKTSSAVRVFEPIGWGIDIEHPHYIDKSTFTNVLGDFGEVYKGGSVPNFHAADCYYGTWIK